MKGREAPTTEGSQSLPDLPSFCGAGGNTLRAECWRHTHTHIYILQTSRPNNIVYSSCPSIQCGTNEPGLGGKDLK
jgi:hypothetical protein